MNKTTVLKILYFSFWANKISSSVKFINQDNIFSCFEGFSGHNCDGT
jgi:hypothetical protein